MDSKAILAFLFCGVLFLNSCIQDEAPNAEADIYTCYVPDFSDYLQSNDTILVSRSDFEVNIIIQQGKLDKESYTICPSFTLTEGATIIPSSGSSVTFSKENSYTQIYTVTSQDGKYHKDYTVRLKEPSNSHIADSDTTRTYHFDNSFVHEGIGGDVSKYHVLYEILSNGTSEYIWESANAGFALTNGKKAKIEDYPTYNAENGYLGKCARLKTSLVGALGKMVGMPMAAGNFFIGSFETANALKAPLTSTKFGIVTYRIPKRLDFYYKFKRGEKFTDENMTVLNELDYPDAYAVLYRPYDRNGIEQENLLGKAPTLLDGTSILPDKSGALGNIVAVAKWDNKNIIIDEDIENANFHHEEVPFEFVSPYTSINQEDLKNGKYYLTLVFTSSYKGDYFYGAEGSTLYVDEATITFEPEE